MANDSIEEMCVEFWRKNNTTWIDLLL